jgi:hypothetical protein
MWFVVVHSNKDFESKVIGKFNTRTNAQLFVDSYVIQTVLDHNGSGTSCDAVTRKDIEKKLNDLSINNENRYYIIRNNNPWGATVNKVHIRQLEMTTVDEVDAIETQEIETIVKVPKQLSIPGGWFSRAKTCIVEEEQTVKVPKQINVKQVRVMTTSRRITDSDDVFTCFIVYDDSHNALYELARQERIGSTSEDCARCKDLASRIANTDSFKKFDGVSTVSVKFCKKEFPNEFGTYKALSNTEKVLNKIKPKTNFVPLIPPSKDNSDLGLLQHKNTIKPPPPPPQPAKSINPGSSLAHLNNDIIARHREMFNGIKPKLIEKDSKKKFDDETIENLCDEIERAITASYECSNQDEVNDDTSDTWSESDSDVEELTYMRLSTEDIYGPDEINT